MALDYYDPSSPQHDQTFYPLFRFAGVHARSVPGSPCPLYMSRERHPSAHRQQLFATVDFAKRSEIPG